MPFARRYNDVYFVAIAGACDLIGLSSTRADHDVYTGDIVQHIKDSIRDSVAVVADLSESVPNVMYEVGFAHALGKPTIHICSTPLHDLPFDVQGYNTIVYAHGQTTELVAPLATQLRAVTS
jgi:hypothetical protein